MTTPESCNKETSSISGLIGKIKNELKRTKKKEKEIKPSKTVSQLEKEILKVLSQKKKELKKSAEKEKIADKVVPEKVIENPDKMKIVGKLKDDGSDKMLLRVVWLIINSKLSGSLNIKDENLNKVEIFIKNGVVAGIEPVEENMEHSVWKAISTVQGFFDFNELEPDDKKIKGFKIADTQNDLSEFLKQNISDVIGD